jgi:hypothetical protein
VTGRTGRREKNRWHSKADTGSGLVIGEVGVRMHLRRNIMSTNVAFDLGAWQIASPCLRSDQGDHEASMSSISSSS